MLPPAPPSSSLPAAPRAVLAGARNLFPASSGCFCLICASSAGGVGPCQETWIGLVAKVHFGRRQPGGLVTHKPLWSPADMLGGRCRKRVLDFEYIFFPGISSWVCRQSLLNGAGYWGERRPAWRGHTFQETSVGTLGLGLSDSQSPFCSAVPEFGGLSLVLEPRHGVPRGTWHEEVGTNAWGEDGGLGGWRSRWLAVRLKFTLKPGREPEER